MTPSGDPGQDPGRAPRSAAELAWRYAPLLACGLVLVWHSLQYDFVTDDAYISFVYSRNLAEHGALVFNPGDPVEGYTNFSWTLLLGLLMKLGLAPEVMSRVLGTGFGLATLWVSFRLIEYVLGRGSRWAALAPLLLALSAGFGCWSSGGLETQMFTFLITAALFEYARGDGDQRALGRMAIFLALAAMTRPEGLLVAGVLGGHRLGLNLLRDRRWRPTNYELMAVGTFLLIWGPYFAWRWWYYGHPFPNTYYVKAAGAAHGPDFAGKMIANGLHYVWQWARQTGAVWASPLIVAGLALHRPRSRGFAVGTAALLLGAVYLAYAVKVGGDFMGLHRFIMPVFVLGALGVTLGLAVLVSRLPAGLARSSAGIGAAVVLVGGFGFFQLRLTVESLRWGNFENDQGIDTPAFLAAYANDRALIGKHMKPCFRADDFSIFGGVGAKPYYAEARGIDVFGLVSWDIAHCQPRSRARAGHTKWGENALLAVQPRTDGHRCPPPRPSGGYDWSQVQGGPPDFWFSCYALHRDPTRPGAMCSPTPARDYQQVTLHIPGLKERGEYYTFWIHRERRPTFQCPGLIE
ncbi:MAG TPA: hypothetical protein VML75_23335 [Kofleriaceae bacterium]|nr:hypothetical protein [Kofleriaceae bacterium]